jgi:hypothetical protein
VALVSDLDVAVSGLQDLGLDARIDRLLRSSGFLECQDRKIYLESSKNRTVLLGGTETSKLKAFLFIFRYNETN